MSRSVYSSIVCASWFVAASAGVGAQTPPATSRLEQLPRLDRQLTYAGPPLTLRDAIDEALQRNPTLIALRREFDAARQRPARSQFLSPPTVSAQIWQWPINTLNPHNTNMYMLLIEQEIPGRGKRDLRTAVAQKDADLASNDVAVSARQLLGELKHAYATLLVARNAADVYGESAAVLRQLADVAESKYASGRISQSDVLKPVVELSKLYDDALMFRQQADLASAQLNALMARPVEAPIGALLDESTHAELPALSALVQLATDHQPELQAARLAIERAKADVAAVKGDAKPDFILQGGYMLTPRGTDAWTAQVGITWPSAPWAHGKIDARIAETTAEVSAAEARLQATEQALRLTIQQAYIRVRTAEQRAALLQTTIVPQSRQILEVSRIGYASDRTDVLTLLENQRTLLAEQLDYFRVLADLAEARADLDGAVGIDLGSASTAVASSAKGAR
jgi:outer membrane protein, heavy metal efflux system